MTIRGNQWAAVIKVKMEECCLRWFRHVEKEQRCYKFNEYEKGGSNKD